MLKIPPSRKMPAVGWLLNWYIAIQIPLVIVFINIWMLDVGAKCCDQSIIIWQSRVSVWNDAAILNFYFSTARFFSHSLIIIQIEEEEKKHHRVVDHCKKYCILYGHLLIEAHERCKRLIKFQFTYDHRKPTMNRKICTAPCEVMKCWRKYYDTFFEITHLPICHSSYNKLLLHINKDYIRQALLNKQKQIFVNWAENLIARNKHEKTITLTRNETIARKPTLRP